MVKNEYIVEKSSEYPNEKGVYSIHFKNSKNTKFYVGSASSDILKGIGGFRSRWKDHIHTLRKNKSNSKKLQNAYNKYGEENLIFTILEICNSDECLILEQKYIDLFNSYKFGYNSRPRAENNLGFKHSEKSKLKMVETAKRLRLEKVDDILSYYKSGLSIREISKIMKISKSLIIKILKEFDKSDRRKMARYKGKVVYQYDLNGNFLNSFPSLMDCSEYLKIPESTIRNSINGNHNRIPLYIFSFEILDNEKLSNIIRNCKRYEITQLSLDGEFIKIWPRQKEIFEYFNCEYCSKFGKMIPNVPIIYKGFMWVKVNPPII